MHLSMGAHLASQPKKPTMTTRKDMWNRLEGDVDLLIVGGGINGAGIARDAARRGLKVAVCEMYDLAWGTSSRSSKLVHGGLRYLETFEFSLVFESVSERRILLEIAPHLVNPLGFLFPIYKGAKVGLAKIEAGMWLYDGLSLFRSPKRHRTMKKKKTLETEPLLNAKGLKGAPLYYDCSTDDARLTLETAIDAVEHGAVIATRAKVVRFVRGDANRVVGAVVRDTLSSEEKTVRAKAVINATGPWTDSVVAMSDKLDKPLLRPTKGVHIVVDYDKVPVKNAVVCNHPIDERVLFAIPWGDQTYIGTTDTDFDGDPALVAATLEDVDYLIEASNSYFPGNTISREDVLSTWAGLRPLMSPVGKGGEVAESEISREHQIIVGINGLITIAGGKLTTYRKMSAEVVDTALNMLMLLGQKPEGLEDPMTAKAPLPGAVGWPEDDDHDAVAKQISEVAPKLSPETARLLADTYGMRGLDVARLTLEDQRLATPLVEGRAELLAQVKWGVEQELAATVDDVMTRRTQLFFRDRDQGLTAVPLVASYMAELLGWTDVQTAVMVKEYQDLVALSRRWQDEL